MSEKLEITKERVLSAAGKCGTAKEVLKELFPEVFKDEWEDVTDECRFSPASGGGPLVVIGEYHHAVFHLDNALSVLNFYDGFKIEDGRIWRKKSA